MTEKANYPVTDGIIDDLGFVAPHARTLQSIEKAHASQDQSVRPLSKREALAISFNKHPVVETAVGTLAVFGAGFALGGTVASYIRGRHSLKPRTV